MTTTAIPSLDVNDFKSNIQDFDRMANGAGTYTDRFGDERLTLDEFMRRSGYEAPVAFASGIAVSRTTQTVTYNGDTYHAAPSAVPFTTAGTFNPAQWLLLRQNLEPQGIVLANKVITGFDATGLQNNAWVHFAGRDTIGDGGGGWLRFIAGSTATADGGTVYAVTGGRLVRDVGADGVDFMWYGPLLDGSDENVKLQAAIVAAKASAFKMLRLPTGTIGYSDTLLNDNTFELRGAGRDKTILKFLNATVLKSAVKYVKGSSKSCWAHFTLADGTFGTSRGIELYDTITGTGSPVWKNVFFGVEIVGFAESHAYTSDNPLSGANHAHCSENLWLHCRFVNNKVLCLNQNSQAVNNHYIHCDGENFDTTYFGSPVTDANFEMFRDEAGGGVIVSGGSWIGRGKLFSWKYPASGSNLFSGGTFTAKDLRMELRTTHNGVVVNEDVHGNTGSSLSMSITLKDIDTVNYGATIGLIAFGGRVNALVDNVKVVGGAGKLQIKQYPTIGRSANTTTGSQGSVDVINSDAIDYVKATSSPYGTYNADYVARVSFQGQGTASTNASFSTDADGWSSLNGGSDVQQLGMRLGYCRPFGRLTVASDVTSSGLSGDFKIIMPKGGRPLKLFAFKHPQQFANNTGYELYLAKDKASWVNPASFDYLTDAVLVAAMPTTANKAGYFEIDVQLVSNSLGNQLQAGFGSWTEGRMFLRKIGANPFPGFVGVEYI